MFSPRAIFILSRFIRFVCGFMTHNGKLLVYVSKCTYFRPKMTNSRVDVNFLAGEARNYETKIRNPVDFGDNFKGFFHCSFREEGRRRRRKKTNFYWISPFFFHSFLHFQSSSHPFTLIPVAFRNARSVKLLAESR